MKPLTCFSPTLTLLATTFVTRTFTNATLVAFVTYPHRYYTIMWSYNGPLLPHYSVVTLITFSTSYYICDLNRSHQDKLSLWNSFQRMRSFRKRSSVFSLCQFLIPKAQQCLDYFPWQVNQCSRPAGAIITISQYFLPLGFEKCHFSDFLPCYFDTFSLSHCCFVVFSTPPLRNESFFLTTSFNNPVKRKRNSM